MKILQETTLLVNLKKAVVSDRVRIEWSVY